MVDADYADTWTRKQRIFIEWTALPTELREIRTARELGLKIGVSQDSLTRWKKLPGFWDEVAQVARKYLGDSVPEAFASLKDMARRGSYQHQKLYFEMLSLYVPRIAPTTPDGKHPYAAAASDDLFSEIEAIFDKARTRSAGGDTE